MKKVHKFLILILFFIPELKAQLILYEDFESGTLNPLMSLETAGSFVSSPGIIDNTSFGSNKVFTFGRSICGSSCFDNYKTTLTINFAVPTYVESLMWKEMEILGNWGSQGIVMLDDNIVNGSSLGALPVNSRSPDTLPRDVTLVVKQVVSTIKLIVTDITSASEIIIDDFRINSSPQIIGYEYWFNNDFYNKISTQVSSAQQSMINLSIPATDLANGSNLFNLRVYDNNGKYSNVLSHIFYKFPQKDSASNNLVSYEYWFDDDYENALTINTSAQQIVTLNELVNTNILMSGAHSFNIRFRDNDELWSSVISQLFYKMPEQQNFTYNAVSTYKYWIDNDFDNAKIIIVPFPTPQILLLDNLDLKTIPKGNHSINFQFKDNSGLWSSVTTDSFMKQAQPISDFSYESEPKCDSTLISFINNSIDSDIYLWDFGDGTTGTVKNPVHVYYSSGNYDVSLTVTDTSSSLDNKFTISIHVDVKKIDPSVKQEGTVLTALQSEASYQWLDCNNNFTAIEGENNQSFNVTVNGSYAVIISQDNCSVVSECFTVNPVNILENKFDRNIILYPNPTDGLICIDMGLTYNSLLVTINDMNGREIKKIRYDNSQTFNIDLSSYLSGTYLVTLRSGNKTAVLRVIKN